jgi:hypothetical protein
MVGALLEPTGDSLFLYILLSSTPFGGFLEVGIYEITADASIQERAVYSEGEDWILQPDRAIRAKKTQGEATAGK